MWKFWGGCVRRAWCDTLELLGWRSWPRFLARTGAAVIALVLIAVVGSAAAADHRVAIVASTAVAGVAVALLAFLFALMRAPYLAHQELLPRAPKNEEYGRELAAHFFAGQELLRRYDDVTKDDSKEWLAEFHKWFADVEELMQRKSPPDEAFMFASISPSKGIWLTKDAVPALHARLSKLRLIIGRYLQAPQEEEEE
jgi:hypothetical protein